MRAGAEDGKHRLLEGHGGDGGSIGEGRRGSHGNGVVIRLEETRRVQEAPESRLVDDNVGRGRWGRRVCKGLSASPNTQDERKIHITVQRWFSTCLQLLASCHGIGRCQLIQNESKSKRYRHRHANLKRPTPLYSHQTTVSYDYPIQNMAGSSDREMSGRLHICTRAFSPPETCTGAS